MNDLMVAKMPIKFLLQYDFSMNFLWRGAVLLVIVTKYNFAELGGAVQLMGIIRLLVDPENMLGTTNVSAFSLAN